MTAHGGHTNTIRESALKYQSRRKIPCCTREWNRHLQHARPDALRTPGPKSSLRNSSSNRVHINTLTSSLWNSSNRVHINTLTSSLWNSSNRVHVCTHTSSLWNSSNRVHVCTHTSSLWNSSNRVHMNTHSHPVYGTAATEFT